MIGFVGPSGLPGAIPTQQVDFAVGSGMAWAIVLTTLALACALVWVMTGLGRPELHGAPRAAGEDGVSRHHRADQRKLSALGPVGTPHHRRAA